MDDDDDHCLLDILGEPPALNYFLHRSGSKLTENDLNNVGFSAAIPNSVFGNSINTDPKSSIKSVDNPLGEISSDELCLPTSLQFLEDELDSSSPLQELVEDQPFDILQKSLQEANITEQTLAEEAYLDASSGSSQQFAQASLHSSVSSFTQVPNVSNYSGQTLQPVGVGHAPLVQQAVDTSFGNSAVNAQQSFMQVGVNNLTTQQLSSSSQIVGSPGQIHLLGSVSTQPSMMTINHLDGSHIILKGNGQQRPANMSSGLLVQRQSPSGSSLYGSHNPNVLAQSVGSPFSNCNVAASLPVHNIIIQRSPNPTKVPINIQPKPNQVGHQAVYSTQMHQHHVRHGVPYPQSNSQNSSLGHQMTVSIVNQQNMRKSATPQSVNPSGSGIVIHSPMGQPHAPQNRFFLPTNLSVNSSSVHHIQTLNGQLLHNPSAHMMTGQVPSEHMIVNQNSMNMVMANQSYSGQILTTQSTAVQLVSGQPFTASGGQVQVNHGTSQTVGGQVQQISPTVLHLSPSQGSIPHGKSGFAAVHAGQPLSQVMPLQNQYAVMDTSSTVCPNMGPPVQPVISGASISGVQHSQQIQTQVTVSSTHCLPDSTAKTTCTYSQATTQQPFASPQVEKKLLSQPFSGLTSDPQDGLKQPQLTSLLGNKMLPGHSNSQAAGKVAGGAVLQHHFGKIQQHQEKQTKQACFQQSTQADGRAGGQKRSASSQLTKGNLILKQIQKDQSHVVTPDKTPFTSLEDTFERLLPYHVFQGSLPTEEELKKVDDEFEVVATQMLKRSHAMLNKYRWLLLEEAVRVNPSAEMVMIDRMFNQEERTALSHDKRLALMDPDGYLADFCCLSKCLEKSTDKAQFMETTSASASYLPDQKDHCLIHSSGIVSASVMNTGKDKGDFLPPGKMMQKNINENKLEDINRLLEAKKHSSHCSEEKVLDSCGGSLGSVGGCLGFVGASPVSFKNGTNADRLPSKTVNADSMSSCNNSFQDKIQNSLKNESVCLTARESSESQEIASLNEHIESTFKSILELKKKQTELESKTTLSSNSELQLPKFIAVASQGNCLEKFAADHKEGAAETDSVLEAAVNSILEC